MAWMPTKHGIFNNPFKVFTDNKEQKQKIRHRALILSITFDSFIEFFQYNSEIEYWCTKL